MPPHVDLDASHDEWPRERSWPASPPAGDPDYPSPLFLDYRELPLKVPPESLLDLRQSDPDLSAAPPGRAGDATTAAPRITAIEAIIGPESRYIRMDVTSTPTSNSTTSSSGTSNSSGNSSSSTSRGLPARMEASGALPRRPARAGNPNPLAHASARASKKSWKAVKSLPNKLASTVGSMKVPSVKVTSVRMPSAKVPRYRNAI